MVSASLEGGVGVLVADRELDLADAALKANQVLVQLGLLLLQRANLVVQFHIFHFLLGQVTLQLVLDAKL